MPHTWVFLPNATTSGVNPSCWKAHGGAGDPAAGLHLVGDHQRVELVAQIAHRREELRAEVPVAALALDGFGDEAGDVVRVGFEGRAGLPQRLGLDRVHIGTGPDVGRVDAGPVELREAGHLVGVGVRQRQRVAAAAVEGAAQVQHPGAQRRVDTARLVVPALPVECDLERVLHRQRAAVDEEQVRQGGVAEHPGERLDEPGHRHGVDVGVGRLVHRGLRQLGAEAMVLGQRRVVHAQRRGREEREHVEVLLAVAGVDQVGSGRAVEVEHQVQSVGQDAAGQHCVDIPRFDGGGLGSG